MGASEPISQADAALAAASSPAGRDILDRVVEFFKPLDGIHHANAFELTFWTIADAMSRASGADLTSIWVPNPNTQQLQLACSTLRGKDQLPEELPFRDTRSGNAIATGKPRFYPDLHAYIPCAGSRTLERSDLTKMWCVPLLAPSLGLPNDVVAVATVHFKTESRADQLGDPFVTFCGVRAGRVIERALWAEQDAVVQQVYRAMGGIDQGVWSIMDEVAATIAKLLHFAACSILLADHTVDVLHIIGTTGIRSPKPRPEWLYAYNQGATGRVAATKQIIASEDIDKETWCPGPSLFPEVVDGHRARQFLAAPICSPDGRLVGVIRLRNKQQHEEANWPLRLNHLDWLRIERVARVLAPLLSLTAEKMYQESVLKRIRHDQKAPANMIRNFASYYVHLKREKLVQDLDALYQGLEDCESLADLIITNADLTRIDAVSGIDLKPEHDFLLSGFVARVCKMFRRICREKGLKGPVFDDDFHAIPKLWVDPILMQIVLYNLLDNAAKYSHSNTEIRVASECMTSDEGKRYRIHVDNWGIGVSEADRERVFDRQFRTSEARGLAVTGLGLGLTIARAIVERHGGRLSVTNLTTPTTFTIDLPGILATRAPQ
ncbi:MAG: GAF domain-containing sensor histidine kinase [Phycisphaerae bacterium]|nr:GAF domain-containing sensor histidine kinase [Phycisphaerae bacterium]